MIAVVISESGLGVPVVPVEDDAPAAVVSTNGLGMPVVIVEENGTPLVIEGLPEP